MKKIRVIYIIVFLFCLFPNIVIARSKTKCDYTLLSNIKNMTNNINITYTYHIENDIAYFDITLTNLKEDIYFIDNTTNKAYYYTDTNNGEITINNYSINKVSYSFYSNNSECLDEKLTIKYVNLPLYNYYYNYPECEGVTNLKACEKWSGYVASEEEFRNTVNSYKNKNSNNENSISLQDTTWFNKLVKMYTTYYYIITPLFVGVIVGIVYLIKYIEHRRNRFKI